MLRWILILTLSALALGAPASGQIWERVTLPDGPGPATPKPLDIAVDGDTVWFSTEFDGIMGFDGRAWVVHTVADGGLRSNSFRYVMFVDAAGDKWTAKDGISTVDRLNDGGTFTNKTDDVWSYYSQPGQLNSTRVFSMDEDSRGNKWFGIRDENNVESSIVELLIENGPGTADDEWMAFGGEFEPYIFSSGDVRRIAVDNQDRLWLVYDRLGVDVWDYGEYDSFTDDTIVHYGVTDGLPSDAVYDVYPAADGRVWVGCQGGAAYLDPSTRSWVTIDLGGYSINRVNDIEGDAWGHVWMATDNGVVMLYTTDEVARVYTELDGLAAATVNMLAVDGSYGTVWAVTQNDSLTATHLNMFRTGFEPERRVFVFPNPWREGESPEMIKILGAPAGSTVEILDLSGERMRKLAPVSTEYYLWDSLDASLNEVPSGVYIVRVKAPSGEHFFTKVAVIR